MCSSDLNTDSTEVLCNTAAAYVANCKNTKTACLEYSEWFGTALAYNELPDSFYDCYSLCYSIAGEDSDFYMLIENSNLYCAGVEGTEGSNTTDPDDPSNNVPGASNLAKVSFMIMAVFVFIMNL